MNKIEIVTTEDIDNFISKLSPKEIFLMEEFMFNYVDDDNHTAFNYLHGVSLDKEYFCKKLIETAEKQNLFKG